MARERFRIEKPSVGDHPLEREECPLAELSAPEISSGLSQKSANQSFSSRAGLNGGVTDSRPAAADSKSGAAAGNVRKVEELEKPIDPRLPVVAWRGIEHPPSALAGEIGVELVGEPFHLRTVCRSLLGDEDVAAGEDFLEPPEHAVGSPRTLCPSAAYVLLSQAVSPMPPGTLSNSAIVNPSSSG